MNLRRRRIRDGCHGTLEGMCCLSPTMEPILREEARDRRAEHSREDGASLREGECHTLKQRAGQTGRSAVHFAGWPCLPEYRLCSEKDKPLIKEI